MVVSAAAVALRPVQAVNALKDKQINILQVAGIYDPSPRMSSRHSAHSSRKYLDLDAGVFTDEFDPATFDDQCEAAD